MDKEWTKKNPASKEYQNGLDSFLDYAYTKGKPRGKEILCPCANCYNSNWFTRNEVKNHLIAKIKREHAAEIRQFNDKLQEMEEKHRQDKEETDRKIQVLLKTVLNQNTSELNIEALAALISTPATDANSVLRSSTSTHAPTNDQVMNDNINEDFEFEDEET
ncbi:unnamed protein product [Lathyrus sativus]|nr:unnamed protein product [Lathyrus sativus]